MNFGRYSTEQKLKKATADRISRKAGLIALKLFILLFAVFVVGGSCAAYGILSGLISSAPDISTLTVAPTEAATYIYDQNGNRVQKLTAPSANRDLVNLSRIPQVLQDAVVAVEDERFYEHDGIDLKGIARAFVVGVTSGNFSEGASTITQQLLKNSVFPDWMNETSLIDKFKRKFREQYLALELEKVYPKERILEDYLNAINLGAGCYGVQAASYRYFGKDVSELNLSESAVIAGITQNPTAYNPITYPEQNAKRRRVVLDKMLEQEYISQAEYDEAMADQVYDRILENDSTAEDYSIYTYYQDALIDQAIEALMTEKGYSYKQAAKMVYSGGLRIYSAQDDAIQAICDEEFSNPANYPAGTEVGLDYALSIETADGETLHYGNESVRSYVQEVTGDDTFNLLYASEDEARSSALAFKTWITGQNPGSTVVAERVSIVPQPQASVVVIDQSTGFVKAIVGGRGEKEASLTLNRATDTTRQPGSTFKILTTYAPALDACGKTLATVYDNSPYQYEDGTEVSNWDLNNYTGPTTIREAIVRSVNIVAVKCITEITPKLGFDYAKALGISTLYERYEANGAVLSDVVQSLSLGGITEGVTNLELCAAYAAIANNGGYLKPKFFTKILDVYGNVIIDNTTDTATQVLKPTTAYLLTDAMRGVITDPEGTAFGTINLGSMPVAGKSGTTSDDRDIWFAGYTPYYTCCVWGGYDNNDELPGSDPLYHTYNKVLWNAIMNRIHLNLQITAFRQPPGIVSALVCSRSGKLAVPGLCEYDASGSTVYEELFAEGTEPTELCDAHLTGDLCNDTGLVAGSGCSSHIGVITRDTAACDGSHTDWESLLKLSTLPGETDDGAPQISPELLSPAEESDTADAPAETSPDSLPDHTGQPSSDGSGEESQRETLTPEDFALFFP